jgi:N-acetylneuraminate lyase
VERQLAQGIAGFYVGGSTGEAFLQSLDERAAFLRAVAAAAAGRCRLIAHVGAVATADCLVLGRVAVEAGYDAISAIPPFYYDFSRDEAKAHYRALGAELPLPLIVYNFGGRVGRLTSEDLLELLDDPRVIGVKHTSQDLYLLERFKRHRPEAVIYNGFDEMCLAGLAMGADGAIGTTYNFMGDLFVRLAAAFAAGRLAEARALQVTANRVIDVLIEVGVFPGTKAMLALMGFDAGTCRPPFRALTAADLAKLAACVDLLRGAAVG